MSGGNDKEEEKMKINMKRIRKRSMKRIDDEK